MWSRGVEKDVLGSTGEHGSDAARRCAMEMEVMEGVRRPPTTILGRVGGMIGVERADECPELELGDKGVEYDDDDPELLWRFSSDGGVGIGRTGIWKWSAWAALSECAARCGRGEWGDTIGVIWGVIE